MTTAEGINDNTIFFRCGKCKIDWKNPPGYFICTCGNRISRDTDINSEIADKILAEEYSDYTVNHWHYSNERSRIIKAMVQLSEHSTKEPVAWLCEKEGCISRVVSEEEIILHYYKEHGYTVTPLVKK